MGSSADRLFQWLLGIPELSLYIILGVAAALENLVPPIPADVVVLIGGVLAGMGGGRTEVVFVVVWAFNVAGALGVYGLGRRHGPRFFEGRIGHLLLKPRQLATLSAFYGRYGPSVIFLSRFLPMFRAVVPVFAGVTQVSLLRTAVPIAVASALWYGTIVYAGAVTGRNWHRLVELLDAVGLGFGIVAGLLAVAVFLWWRRSRRILDPEPGPER